MSSSLPSVRWLPVTLAHGAAQCGKLWTGWTLQSTINAGAAECELQIPHCRQSERSEGGRQAQLSVRARSSFLVLGRGGFDGPYHHHDHARKLTLWSRAWQRFDDRRTFLPVCQHRRRHGSWTQFQRPGEHGPVLLLLVSCVRFFGGSTLPPGQPAEAANRCPVHPFVGWAWPLWSLCPEIGSFETCRVGRAAMVAGETSSGHSCHRQQRREFHLWGAQEKWRSSGMLSVYIINKEVRGIHVHVWVMISTFYPFQQWLDYSSDFLYTVVVKILKS